jgi:hypothetical protein
LLWIRWLAQTCRSLDATLPAGQVSERFAAFVSALAIPAESRKNPRRENAGNKETRKSPFMTAKEKQAAKTKKTKGGAPVRLGSDHVQLGSDHHNALKELWFGSKIPA